MKKVVALVIPYQRISAIRKEERNDLEVESLARPEDWSCLGIAAFRIDVGACLDQEMAQGMVSVDGGPLPSHQPLLYLYIHAHCSFPTCNAVMPWSSVDRALYLPLSKSLWMARSSPNLASCIKSCSTGSCRGGLESRSLSSTLSRPSLLSVPGDFWWSLGEVEDGREGMFAYSGLSLSVCE